MPKYIPRHRASRLSVWIERFMIVNSLAAVLVIAFLSQTIYAAVAR